VKYPNKRITINGRRAGSFAQQAICRFLPELLFYNERRLMAKITFLT